MHCKRLIHQIVAMIYQISYVGSKIPNRFLYHKHKDVLQTNRMVLLRTKALLYVTHQT